MKKFYFTPGPSQLYYTTEAHIKHALKHDICSISHRSDTFKSIYKKASDNLRELFGLADDQYILFTASATEVWERIIQNLVGKEAFHLVNGAFSLRFQKVAESLGKRTFNAEVPEGSIIDVGSILIPETTELIALAHNETSTGAMVNAEDIYKLKEAFPSQLLALDVTSSAPVAEIDYTKVDTAYFSVQKCFGIPAGLGVWIINQKCIDKCWQLINKGFSVGSYHSIPEMMAKAKRHQTSETPNVLALYLLSKVSEDMLNKGLLQIRREAKYKAAVLYQAMESCDYLSPFVKNEKNRSLTTLVAKSSVPSSAIIEALQKKGIVIGPGYGKFREGHIRIANFPTHSKEHVEMIADLLTAMKF